MSTDLRERRKGAGLTLDQLAAAARCSVATCRLLEKGWRPETSRTLRRIELVLQSYEAPGSANGQAGDLAETQGGATDDPRRNY